MSRPPIGPVKVVVTDDSDVVTRQLVRILGGTAGIEVVGVAHSLRELHELVRAKRPDVVTLDLLLPVGTGLSEIARLRLRSNVVVVSDSAPDSMLATEALARGASAFVVKRSLARPEGRATFLRTILGMRRSTSGLIVAVAGSTGAIPALEIVLKGLVDVQASTLVVQHLPSDRVGSLTEWLTSIGVRASVADAGAPLVPGSVLVAPGDRHLAVGPRDLVRIDDQGPIAGHRPSATVLFESLVPYAKRSVAVVLSGMGRDGADALPTFVASGGTVLAQRVDTCAVGSMPKAALAASKGRGRGLAPDEIAPEVRRLEERLAHG